MEKGLEPRSHQAGKGHHIFHFFSPITPSINQFSIPFLQPFNLDHPKQAHIGVTEMRVETNTNALTAPSRKVQVLQNVGICSGIPIGSKVRFDRGYSRRHLFGENVGLGVASLTRVGTLRGL